MITATSLIDLLNLDPLPEEGGYFRRTYLAKDKVPANTLPSRYQRDMPLVSAIYYLLTTNDFSAMHRLQTDEMYHFYYGDPVELLLLYPDGKGETFLLGTDFMAGMRPQKLVPRDVWQGSVIQPNGKHGFALIGTTMSPAYDDISFELGQQADLIRGYPEFVTEINGRVSIST